MPDKRKRESKSKREVNNDVGIRGKIKGTDFNELFLDSINRFTTLLPVLPDDSFDQMQMVPVSMKLNRILTLLVEAPATKKTYTKDVPELFEYVNTWRKILKNLEQEFLADQIEFLEFDDIEYGNKLNKMNDKELEEELKRLLEEIELKITEEDFNIVLMGGSKSGKLRKIIIAKRALAVVIVKFIRSKFDIGDALAVLLEEAIYKALLKADKLIPGKSFNGTSISSGPCPGEQCLIEVYLKHLEIFDTANVGKDWHLDIYVEGKMAKTFRGTYGNGVVYDGEMLLDTLTRDGCEKKVNFPIKVRATETEYFTKEDVGEETQTITGHCPRGAERQEVRTLVVAVTEDNDPSAAPARVSFRFLIKWKCSAEGSETAISTGT